MEERPDWRLMVLTSMLESDEEYSLMPLGMISVPRLPTTEQSVAIPVIDLPSNEEGMV